MADYPTIHVSNPDIHGQIALDTGETVLVFTSTHDGALVFQVETSDNGRRIRVSLNDGILFDADPEEA